MKTKVRTPTVTAVLAAAMALLVAGGGLVARAHAGEETHPAPKGMSVKVTTRLAPSGVLVHLKTRKFRWAPEHLSPVHGQGQFISGEGHGHVYVDASTTPATMVVGPWTYLRLEPGRHTLRVTLNGNDHLEYRRNGHAVQDSVSVTIPEAAMEG